MVSRNGHGNMNIFKSIIMLFKRIGVLYKLIKDPHVAVLKKIMVIGGLFYVISPIDIIADPILGFGFIDDTVLMMYIISKITDELDQYISPKNASIDKRKIIDDIEYKVDDE